MRHQILCVAFSTLFLGVVGQDPQNWTFLVFAVNWPPGACLDVPEGRCTIPEGVIGWTIHGLWPTADVGYPSFCNSSWPFQPKALDPILPALKVKWPTIYPDATDLSFWRHEWLKHGTCAASDKILRGELNYFKKSLDLLDHYNIDQMLKEVNIRPDATKSYLLKYIENVINLHVTKKTKIFCNKHKNYTVPILNNLYICTDKALNVIDCGEFEESSCDSSYVMYLPFDETRPNKENDVTYDDEFDKYSVNVI